MVSNFDAIFNGKLQLLEDTEGNVVSQFYTGGGDVGGVGTIDILAKEPASNALVVIELKKGRESDKVVGQTLR